MNANDNEPLPVLSEPPPAVLDVAPIAKPAPPSAAERTGSVMWSVVLPTMFLVSMLALVIYSAPFLLYHWRMLDIQAETEAAFQRRRAELKADAEHADQRLDLLDKRVQLTSLGFRAVVRKVRPLVVNVANYRTPTSAEMEKSAARELTLIPDPDNDRKYVPQGMGSGLILKPGVILTNHHVVRKAKRLRIIFPSGRSIGVDVEASVSDVRTDLAVIRLPDNLRPKLQEEAAQTAVFADSDKDVQVGDFALAVGNPHDLRQSVTQGIISAKGRLMRLLDMVELIQTDAAINPGNSGGPLFDIEGRVVGINVAISSDTGGNQGIGFAIPSNTAKKISEQLLTGGEVRRGYLGVSMQELTGKEAKARNLDDGAVLVKDVVPGAGADRAGIKPGDLIVRINKTALHRWEPMRHVRQIIADLEPDAQIIVEVLRGEERMQITVTIGKRPAHLP